MIPSIWLLAFSLLAAAPFATPVDVQVPVAPAPVKAEDGVHLTYEVHLTNFRNKPLELVRLAILNGSKEVAAYEGVDLRSRMRRIAAPDDADPRVLAPGMRAVAFIDLVCRTRAEVPASLRHRFSTAEETWEDEGVATIRQEAAVVEAPLQGERWVAMNGLSNTSSHRRTIVVVSGKARIAQRFASDWTRLSADGQPFHDDPAKNGNWYAYGAAVHSVADGVVVEVQDGIPENDPTAGRMAVPITLETVGGNYVVIAIGRGRFAFYAHLQPRSLRVKAGDRVHAGQLLALLGNSGNSDA
ncbi:MAG TPA: M23 family metallopeptidase, partial [Thermoanaerobaculia bacterium]